VVLAPAAPTPAAPTPAAPTPAAAQAADRTAALERDNAQLRLLGEHEATMLEAERQDMARAVHDGVAQNLLALRLDAALLNKRSLAHHGPLRERSGAALDNIDATLRSVRAILNRLRPAVLELGLQATLDWQLAEFRKHSGLACTLDVQDEQVFDCLDGVASLMLFRQLQAVLESVQRDGGASAVAVSLRRNGGSGVQLMLTDDGAGDGGGVPVAGRRQRQALAMLGVGERLRAHGGTLDVAYGTGQGCRVSMRLPGRNS
jgi:signal transduction histidine kinase